MIRVLHVISGPVAGGAEVYVLDLARAQKAAGADPHVAFLGSAADAGRDAHFETEFLVALDQAGIPHFIIGHECRRNLPKGIWRVARYCRRHRVSHYHSHLVYGLVFGALLRVPRFFTEHSEHIRGGRFVRRCLNSFVEAYVAISNKCARSIESVVGKRPTIIFNAVDMSRLIHNERPAVPDPPFKLLSVGRIQAPKNYPLLIEALARLNTAREIDFIAQIAGDGTSDAIAALEDQATKAGIRHRLRFLGNRDDIAELMAASDLLLMSSAWEGLPIVLIEAVGSHLPFVATDVGGCHEIVEMTGAGIVVPPGDADALARATLELLTDHGRREAMRKAAARNSAGFMIGHAAQAHLDLYRATTRS